MFIKIIYLEKWEQIPPLKVPNPVTYIKINSWLLYDNNIFLICIEI